jgi:hypothetical protein
MNRSRLFLSPGIGVLMAVAFACARASAPVEGATPTALQPGASQQKVIVHLLPRPDSVGGVPEKFEWTAVPNADSYSIGLWNEVDRMIFRQNGLKSNALQWPRDFPLEMGTYLWSVTALGKDDRPLADSGLAAFVVNK